MECEICKNEKKLHDFMIGEVIKKIYICKNCIKDFKTCTKCKITKHVSNFYGDRHAKDGRMFWCKSCSNKNRNKKINSKFVSTNNDFRRSLEELNDLKSTSTDLNFYDI